MGNTRIRMAAALAVPTLFLTACGGQNESGTDGPPATAAAAAARSASTARRPSAR